MTGVLETYGQGTYGSESYGGTATLVPLFTVEVQTTDGGEWEAIECDVRSIDIHRGRSKQLDQFTAATCTVALADFDDYYSAWNPSGVWSRSGLFRTDIPIRVRAIAPATPALLDVPAPSPGEIMREPFNDLTAWSVVGPAGAIIEPGRHGTGVRVDLAGTNLTRTLAGAEMSDVLTFGFAFKVQSLANTRTLVVLRNNGTATLLHNVNVTTAGALTVTLGSSPALITSASGLVAVDTWYYLELQIKLHDTAGTATLRLNGSTVGTFAGDTKMAGAAATYETFRITGQADGTDVWYDDLYLRVGAGEDFAGDIGDAAVLPSAGSDGFTSYALFTGTTDDVVDSWPGAGADALTEVRATDAFKSLARARPAKLLAAVGAGDTPGQRVGRVLDAVSYTGARNLEPGTVPLAGTVLDGTAIALADEARECEWGALYVDREGTIRLRARDSVVTDPRQSTVQWTFDDQDREGPCYNDLRLIASDEDVYNVASITRGSGTTPQVSQDAPSVAWFGPRTYTRDLPINTDVAALTLAQTIVTAHANNDRRVDAIELDPGNHPELWPCALDVRMLDRVRVIRRTGVVIDAELQVQSIHHAITGGGDGTAGTWTLTLETTNARKVTEYGQWDRGQWDVARWSV